jgi:hypothetical protein
MYATRTWDQTRSDVKGTLSCFMIAKSTFTFAYSQNGQSSYFDLEISSILILFPETTNKRLAY